jgi:hypothetical protein
MAIKTTSTRPVRTRTNGGSMSALSVYQSLQSRQRRFLFCLVKVAGQGNGFVYTRQQVLAACADCGMSAAPAWIAQDPARRVARGTYSVPEAEFVGEIASAKTAKVKTVAAPAAAPVDAPAPDLAVAAAITSVERFVPDVDPNYVPWGNFSTVRSIVKSGVFYPMWITGLSGNGKTTMVEQVCAKEGREFFRVNITEETDEDDLLGGFRLINGETVWQDGPVVQAMNRGAVLLLDELDLGSFKCMCLQPVLEGKGVFLKKVGRYVKPTKGFTVFATANTKGKGSDDGRFVGTRNQNEAMLERFKVTIEQPYAPVSTEVSILNKCFASQGVEKAIYSPLADSLAKWADAIRKAFAEGAVDEIVSTRRLVAIAEGFVIFGDLKTAMTMALSRFDLDTRESFMSLYEKMAPAPQGNDNNNAQTNGATADSNACPF